MVGLLLVGLLVDCLFSCSVGTLVGWLVSWLVDGWVIVWVGDRSDGWLVGRVMFFVVAWIDCWLVGLKEVF